MSQVAAATFPDLEPPTPSGIVPTKKRHLKRFPFVFLIDISGSTGVGPDPDITHINDAIGKLVDKILNPKAGSDFARQVDQVDICLITYSDKTEVVIPWSTNKNLPAVVAPFKPQGGTATGRALEKALAYIGDRMRYYRDPAHNIPNGLAHIIHLTDGAPTDMSIGTPRWQQIQDRLTKLNGVERRVAAILHFVSPNGCVVGNPASTMKDETGQDISGQAALIKLSGKPSVFEMGKEVESFETLVQLITVVISKVSELFPAEEAAEQAAKEIKAHNKDQTENE